jgi:hypothetical protein
LTLRPVLGLSSVRQQCAVLRREPVAGSFRITLLLALDQPTPNERDQGTAGMMRRSACRGQATIALHVCRRQSAQGKAMMRYCTHYSGGTRLAGIRPAPAGGRSRSATWPVANRDEFAETRHLRTDRLPYRPSILMVLRRQAGARHIERDRFQGRRAAQA